MSDPPQENPVRRMYDEWSSKTPLVTRSSLIFVVVIYISSFFFSADVILGNTPYFTIMHFEIYRIILAPLVGNSLITILLILLFYPMMGSRMEYSLGSASYLSLLVTFGLVTNIAFDAICLLLYGFGTTEAVFWGCSGFWTILFALIVVECMQMPDAPRRFLCFPVDIPSKFFPLLLYAFFCLFSGFQLDLAVSMLVGYASSRGLLDKVKPSLATLQNMETSGALASCARYPGWVPVNAAQGSSAFTISAPAPSAPPANMFNRMDRNTASAAPGRSEQKDHFPGSGRTLTSSTSSWSSTAASAPSREALAARRLAALQAQDSYVGQSLPPSAPLLQTADASKLKKLMEMGYNKEEASQALINADNNLQDAIQILTV